MTSGLTDPPDFDLPVTGVGMSTRALLLELGFKPVHSKWTDQQPGYQFHFGNLLLEASKSTSMYLRPCIQFSGVWRGTNSINMVDFTLLLTVECYEQGLALIADGLGSYFTPMIPTDWLDQGRRLEDYLPGKRCMRLYDKRPQCFVEADWFRVAAKKLQAFGAAAAEDITFSVSFKEGILKFDLGSEVMAMPAKGESWLQQYRCFTSGLLHISKRTPRTGVWLSAFEDRLLIGRLRLKIENAEALNGNALTSADQRVDLAEIETDPSQIVAITSDLQIGTESSGSRTLENQYAEVPNAYEVRLARAKLRQAELKDKHQAITRESTALVAWCPSGIDQELGSVLIQRGQITESMWLEALSDRVTKLALHEPDPVKAVKWATNLVESRTFGAVSTTTDPRQAGNYLVLGNWQLQQYLAVEMNRHESSFPADTVTDDLEARQAMEETNLEHWVNLATAYSSPTGMD